MPRIYCFHDGFFRFYTYTKKIPPYHENSIERQVFRVRIDRNVVDRYKEKFNCSEDEIAASDFKPSSFKDISLWLRTHPEYPVITTDLDLLQMHMNSVMGNEANMSSLVKESMLQISERLAHEYPQYLATLLYIIGGRE